MSTNLSKLLLKREQIEQRILQEKQHEKRKARAQQIVISALEKHPRLAMTDEQVLRDRIESAFSEIAQSLPSN